MKQRRIWILTGLVVMLGLFFGSPTALAKIHTQNSFELTEKPVSSGDDGQETNTDGQSESQSDSANANGTSNGDVGQSGSYQNGIGTQVVAGIVDLLPAQTATKMGMLTSQGRLPQTSDMIGWWLLVIGMQLLVISGMGWLVIRHRKKNI